MFGGSTSRPPRLTHLTHLPCRLQFPDPSTVFRISSLTPPHSNPHYCYLAVTLAPVLSVLSNISLANTQRWSLNKGAYAAGARLSTTLMTSMFRAAPEESHKLHFSPTRALSTPFLMHSSNPSESYHAALPRSLNKSFPPLPPSRRLPLVPRSGSSSSPRLLLLPSISAVASVRRLSSCYYLLPPIPPYVII